MVIAKSKKVKPTMNNTIKNMDYNWTPAPDPPNDQDAGAARAVFMPHSNSLPFEERRVTLEQPVKIGRNVYRMLASPTNTIFECRVLSRHHATLYYDKGHFYLVDNSSSNGTFVNKCSLPEQEPHEVFSDDVVQFGIPVVENAGNSEKNTFPPVVALLKLFHPDGTEATSTFNPTMSTPLHLEQLYQLNNYVQEAIQREAYLENRLRTLRECVERTRTEAQASWELFVGEQRLLMRVHTLEAMLSVGKQPDAQHVAQLLNDKRNYQAVAQESLRSAHEQRLALEESLERRSREATALQQHNCALRLAANNALAELQKLAARCERKMCAARLAITAAEEREQAVKNQLPLAYSVQNGEAKMLVLSTDSNKLQEAKRGGSLEDAVRALPDYIKLLLPQHLLNKVGIKLITAEGKSAKEFELILNKNNIYNNETREKQQAEEGDVGVGGSGEEKSGEPDSCTDDEKQSRLNNDGGHPENPSPLDGELRPDNNANSTYNESAAEDSPSKAGVEYANVLRVMAGLNEEIRALRERVAARGAECEQLRTARDELLAAQEAPPAPAALPAPAPLPALPALTAGEPDDAEQRARIADLQAQVSRATAAEQAQLSEVARLAASVAQLQAELALRPTRDELDQLATTADRLRLQLRDKEQQLDQLCATNKSTADVAVLACPDDLNDDSMDPKKISAEIDEMFQLDFDEEDEEETDSVATESTEVMKEERAPVEYVKIGEEERLQVTMRNGSLHALEEELVRAKERWAEVAEERARLAAELAVLQSKGTVRVNASHIIALLVPFIAACLYYALLPYIS
ncbi:unnamed protein product [Chilo suppressalis]|uniref:FHA domain-containing protein n=1 Tax=Chilo suppressalis TaxID=168631 RepID=A0ABN8ATJ7_CHISP|nr:unnamed protein product [Chilo suppressalis]